MSFLGSQVGDVSKSLPRAAAVASPWSAGALPSGMTIRVVPSILVALA